MQLTLKDVKSTELLKSTNHGDVIQISTLGGLSLVFLKKKSGDLEMLASSTSSLRSVALASKKRPDLEIPVIVKSAEKTGSKVIIKSQTEDKAKPETVSAKQQLGKILASKVQKKALGGEEQTRKVDTIATQKSVKRNKVKTGTGGYGKKTSFTPPASEEATRKLPKAGA